MLSDEMRERYPGIVAAVQTGLIVVEPALVRCLVHWLGEYTRLKRLPGQSGVPEGVVAAQAALAEAYAATSASRQREQQDLAAAEIVVSGYDAWVGTAEAAAELGISADGVRWHCRHGNLESRRFGRQWMVTAASIEDFKSRKAERSA
jgi:Helix-turn-helix domain